ncbi:Syntaxin-112 [Glycine max]|nr:Syntaxin-112 [Glycine max]
MNDLMTKSFLSYVELKKQARKDLEDDDLDIEAGKLNPTEDRSLSQFFQEVEAIKFEMEEITNLLFDLQQLNEETKCTHGAKVLRGLRDRMESDMVAVLRKALIIKAMLEVLDQSNIDNRSLSESYKEGSPIDRTRMSVTNGLRVKLRDMMNDFQSLRDKILSEHKEDLKRRYYTTTGEVPTEEVMEKMVSGSLKVEFLAGKTDADLGTQVRHEALMDIQRSLNKLHQVFLDMAILVETQGEKLDNIEDNVVKAGNFIHGGTNSLYNANQMKKKNRKWLCWVFAVGLIILLTKALLERCSNVKELMQIYGQLLKKGTIRNQLTSIYSNSNDPEAALLLYHQMLNNSVPDNSYTFPFLLKACSALSAFEVTQKIHAHIIKRGFGLEVYATNSLLRVYAISGNIQSAHGPIQSASHARYCFLEQND